ncbi:MAG TPA: fibronectin type III domain-containing protein [Thermoanaerobaculia bacterium]|nr:fibronectin type III domain-containing protein [Thermoanaerobaculia bacterium]
MTRKLSRFLPLLLATGFVCLPRAADATTFQMVSDANLVRQAAVIAEVTVLASRPARASSYPATEYDVQVERSLKGEAAANSSLTLKVVGGIGPDGIGLKIWGAPAFRDGERALLFLERHADGAWRILHLMLGAFHLVDAGGGRRVAIRDLDGATELQFDGQGKVSLEESPVDRPRDGDAFAAWIADTAGGFERPADYLLALDDAAATLATRYALLEGPGGLAIRWFEFDEGRSIPWRAHSAGQPGLAGGGFAEFQVALAVWNNDAGSNIRYNYLGTTPNNQTGCVAPFPEGKIVFNDPFDEVSGVFSCGEGGVLAHGGPCFDDALIETYQGQDYYPALDALVTTNNGTDCFFQGGLGNRARAAEELFAHELGHTLGLGHTLTRNAIMFRSIHDDERGASLHPDDRAAIAAVYGGSGGSTVGAPSGLTATVLSSTAIRLGWSDNSTNETSFRIERKMGSGSFSEVGNVGANVVTFDSTGLSPATAYTFRVRARAGSASSSYSNQVTATTSAAGPGTPSNLRATNRTASAITLAWNDNASDETSFSIERRDFGDFSLVGTVGANVTTFTDVGLAATTRYEYRVRATNASGDSPYTAILDTNTNGLAGPCVAGTGQLCLLGGEVEVEVTFRNQGNLASGTAVPLTNETGTFWFFSAANTELVVKALDATALNGHYWFFFGALSDVEYWVAVTRTDTGEAQVYYNPQGEICGLADVEALTSAATTGGASVAPRGGLIGLDATAPRGEAGLVTRGSCVADAQTLCLLGSRFAVTVAFTTPSSGSGTGTAVTSTDLTGFFWFFNSTNIELVVKAIDATALNGKYWFFYGALSDVEYTITVTDTMTGAMKTYSNPAGNFCGVGDTSAF